MIIRNDMLSVAQHLERLVVYAKVFEENNIRHWSHLKNREDFGDIYLLDPGDRRCFEQIYSTGRDLAIHMSYKLCAFNYAEEYPTLTSYIESFKDGWLYELEELENISDKAKITSKEIEKCPWSVEQMIVLFDKQHNLLISVKATLDILRRSELYQIENGELPMTKDANTFNISNVSGRININSQDNSINQELAIQSDIFVRIKGAINGAEIVEKDKELLLNSLADLEKSAGSESFTQKYQSFLQSAANHMTILAPFLPALSKLLS